VANKIYGALDTAGGSNGSLDEILQASPLTTGDMAIVIDSDLNGYLYRYNSGLVHATYPESDPQVIHPNGSSVGGWQLVHLKVEDLYVYDDLTVTDDASIGGDLSVTGALDITGALTFDGAGVAITSILDEDDLATDSATALATQQSIKAYVDAAELGWTNSYVPLTGYVSRCMLEWKDADEIYIYSGAYHLRGDSQGEGVHRVEATLTFQVGSAGSNAASDDLGVSEWHYLYIDDSTLSDNGATVLDETNFSNSTTAPTWDADQLGWYDDATGDRCIGAFYSTSSSTVQEFYHDGGDLFQYVSESTDAAVYPGTTFTTTVTLKGPSFARAIEVNHYGYTNSNAGFFYGFYRPTGSSNASGMRTMTGRFADDPRHYQLNAMKTFCSTSQQIDLRVSVADGNILYYLYTVGYYFPRGM
jgi:hypothetical protein